MAIHRPTLTHSGTLFMALVVLAPYAAAQPILTTIYSFNGSPDGGGPEGGLAVGSGGMLYGTTVYGGKYGYGTAFTLTPPAFPGGVWSETVLYSFQGGNDGANPNSTLAIGSRGVLYGTTLGGGGSAICNLGCGTVFSLAPPASAGGAWTETVLHPFAGGNDGVGPTRVVTGIGGVLYGTAVSGGGASPPGGGTVFSLIPPTSQQGTWTFSVLYSFQGGDGSISGELPSAGVVTDNSGVLYGTTERGGTEGLGTVFTLMPPVSPGQDWTETVLYSFGAQSASPLTGVVIGSKGVLYGTTQYSVESPQTCSKCSGVFALIPPASVGAAWVETMIYYFPNANFFGFPYPGPVALGPRNILYGTTQMGGALAEGLIFDLKPPTTRHGSWSPAVLHTFKLNESNEGLAPYSGVLVETNEVLYGTTSGGGTSECNCGTVFSLTP